MSDTRATEISFRRDGQCWRVTFDGRMPGDSPAYRSVDLARAAAFAIVDKEHARAVQEGRLANVVYRAGRI